MAQGSLMSAAHDQDMQQQANEHALENQGRDIGEAVTNASHELDNKQRDVQDAVKDGQHSLEQQATQMTVAQMKASHQQDMKQAKANKPKPRPSA